MSRLLAIAACGLALAACSSSGDVMKTATPTVPLQFESEPAGAEVKTSSGQTCKTPCALAVPASDFMATYAMKGFESQTVPVKLVPADDPRGDMEFQPAGGGTPRFLPNPVYAELERAKAKGAPAKKKPRVAGDPSPRASAPLPDDAPPPRAPAPPSSASPWPPAANPIR